MIRISTIFVAICMVLVAASLGLILYSVAGISGSESAIVALTVLTFLILYNAVSMRLRDRTDVGSQIADLSRGTADLARQVAEFGRRLSAIEGRMVTANTAGSDRLHTVIGEINELGGLVKQLATSVAHHEDLIAAGLPVPAGATPERETPKSEASRPETPRPETARPETARHETAAHDEIEPLELREPHDLQVAQAAPIIRVQPPVTAAVAAAPTPQAPPVRPPEPRTQVAPQPVAPVAAPAPKAAAPTLAPVTSESSGGRSHGQVLAAVRSAIDENRIDIYLQPLVTLPQRKVRFYEAVTRLRDDRDQVLAAEDFIGVAEAGGLIGRIDSMVMHRCVQVLRRLMVRNKEVGIFCNVSSATLSNPSLFAQCLDFLEANRALASSFVLEFKQATLRSLGPNETENLAALAQRGYRFSIDHVTDLRFEPRDLADRGVRYIKVPAALLLDPKQSSAADIHPSDLSDLLGRFGIDLIAERIEGERAVVDLLDYDVRFGQGFLFAPPRPLRPEGASATGGAPAPAANGQNGQEIKVQESNAGHTAPQATSANPPPRAIGIGNAALARRISGTA